MAENYNVTGKGLSRRGFIKTGAGLAGGLMLPGGLTRAFAKDRPAIGTYPEGVSGDTVFIGVAAPLTGPYSAQGAVLKDGYALAIEHLNKGGGLVDKIPTLTGNGLLGKRIVHEVGDSETNANAGVQIMTRFIHDRKAIMITGSVSSAVAVASEQLAQREKVIYMVGESTSNATTGQDRRRYAFRSQANAYMLTKSLAPILAKQLGKHRKAMYLVPDYTSGHSLFNSSSKFTEAQGWTTMGEQLFPTGTTDFSSYLLNIANSGADVFINFAYGSDAINSIQQAKQFGILDKMTMVLPLIGDFLGKSLGAETLQGVYGSLDFWWTRAEEDPMAKLFVDSFEQKYQHKPTWGAELAYSQIMLWADAVARADTYYPPAVIKALEAEHKVHLAIGETYYRACDHQAVRAVPVVVGKKPAEMRNSFDYFKIVGYTPGAEAVPPCDYFPGELGPYT